MEEIESQNNLLPDFFHLFMPATIGAGFIFA